MNIKLKYGHDYQSLFVDDSIYDVDVIQPNLSPGISTADLASTAREALLTPTGNFDWQHYPVSTTKRIAIAINDKTRPVPHEVMLPPLLDTLHGLGFAPESITFYIATGTHVPMPEEDFTKILPDNIIKKYRIVSHDCDHDDNLVPLGQTSRNTLVFVNKGFFTSELKIVVGNIEPHHFMGFSGCNKSASIGLTARSTINQNHTFIVSPSAKVGIYEENPMRQDVEEMGEMIGVHAAWNVIMNTDREIVHFLFGAPLETMKKGVDLCRKVYESPVKQKYDVVIASVGGYPKDINFYQAQKAFTHATLITKQGGTVVLCAECIEGSGSASYEQFVSQFDSYEEALIAFENRPFEIGPHKAYQVAKLLEQVRFRLVSCMPPTLANKLHFNADDNLQKVVDSVLETLPKTASIAIMPKAINTIPIHQG
jgi:lactate racemase